MNSAKIKNEILYDKIPLPVIEISKKWLEKDKDGNKGNRRGQKNLLKMYSIIKYNLEQEISRRYRKSSIVNLNKIYVHLPCRYFQKVFGTQYHKYLDFWKENKVVVVKGKLLDDYEGNTDLFEESKKVESYRVGEYSKGYRLLDFTSSNFQEIEFKLKFEYGLVRSKNIEFLYSVGITKPKITTDNYGFRIYHNLSNSYKEFLPPKGSFIYYDFKASIPCNLKKLIENNLNEQGLYEDPFLKLFDGDFYDNWNSVLNLKLDNRSDIKKNFSTLIYGSKSDINPKILNTIKLQFPYLYNTLGSTLGKKLTRIETNFVLNDVVKNLPVNEVLCLHDGFIVFSHHQLTVDRYLESLNLPKPFELVKSKIGYNLDD